MFHGDEIKRVNKNVRQTTDFREKYCKAYRSMLGGFKAINDDNRDLWIKNANNALLDAR
jgi:hypothetical protein